MLYQLARAYDTTGQPDQALHTLDLIVQRYPAARDIDEVQFRRGELLFSARRYPESEQAYAAVIARGAASSFYVQSLYKSGWSLYKAALPQQSLPVFAKLLDCELLGQDGRVRPLTDLRRADRELVEDTLRVMSITFSQDAGAQSIEHFVGQHGARPYDSLLYSRLGDLYVLEAAVSGRRRDLPGLRRQQSTIGRGSGPGGARHSRLFQGRVQPARLPGERGLRRALRIRVALLADARTGRSP